METYEVSRPSVDNWIAFKFPSIIRGVTISPRKASHYFALHFGTDGWLENPWTTKSNAFIQAWESWMDAGCPNGVFFGQAI